VANATPKKTMSPEEAKARIQRFANGMARKNHFEIFGIERDTDMEKLRESYRLLAKSWHSDAYAGIDLGSEQETLEGIFKQITEAYETLTDPKKRGEYIVFLDRRARGLSTDVNQVLEGERLFDEALMKIKRSDWTGAIPLLESARKANPDDELIVVNIAWAKYNMNRKNLDVARDAVESLRAAIKRQENLPLAYQYIGTIFFNQSQFGEARKYWKLCLEWEPNNIEASRGLRLAATRQEKKASSGFGGLVNKLLGRK
jgi:tetratricopeptide (TPR) repeat protein